jgi:hypothetical protein
MQVIRRPGVGTPYPYSYCVPCFPYLEDEEFGTGKDQKVEEETLRPLGRVAKHIARCFPVFEDCGEAPPVGFTAFFVSPSVLLTVRTNIYSLDFTRKATKFLGFARRSVPGMTQ